MCRQDGAGGGGGRVLHRDPPPHAGRAHRGTRKPVDGRRGREVASSGTTSGSGGEAQARTTTSCSPTGSSSPSLTCSWTARGPCAELCRETGPPSAARSGDPAAAGCPRGFRPSSEPGTGLRTLADVFTTRRRRVTLGHNRTEVQVGRTPRPGFADEKGRTLWARGGGGGDQTAVRTRGHRRPVHAVSPGQGQSHTWGLAKEFPKNQVQARRWSRKRAPPQGETHRIRNRTSPASRADCVEDSNTEHKQSAVPPALPRTGHERISTRPSWRSPD